MAKLPEASWDVCELISEQVKKDPTYVTKISDELENEQEHIWKAVVGISCAVREKLEENGVHGELSKLVQQQIVFSVVASYKALKSQMEADEFKEWLG